MLFFQQKECCIEEVYRQIREVILLKYNAQVHCFSDRLVLNRWM